MAKYNRKMVERIYELIRSDTYTVTEICSNVGISKETFYSWIKEKGDFSDMVTRAREEVMERLVKEAKNSLMKKVKGYEAIETKTVYVDAGAKGESKPKIKESTKIVKHIQPDTSAIIFALTNGDPSQWKNRQQSEMTGKDGEKLIPSQVNVGIDLSLISEEEKQSLLAIARKTNVNGQE